MEHLSLAPIFRTLGDLGIHSCSCCSFLCTCSLAYPSKCHTWRSFDILLFIPWVLQACTHLDRTDITALYLISIGIKVTAIFKMTFLLFILATQILLLRVIDVYVFVWVMWLRLEKLAFLAGDIVTANDDKVWMPISPNRRFVIFKQPRRHSWSIPHISICSRILLQKQLQTLIIVLFSTITTHSNKCCCCIAAAGGRFNFTHGEISVCWRVLLGY